MIIRLKRSTEGVTLAELLVAAGVFVLLIASLAQNSGSPGGLESELAAEVVAEELRSLRALAMRERRPTAIVVPRTSSGYSTGFYTLDGYGPPHVSGGRSFQSELPNVRLIAGTWASSASFEPPRTEPDFVLTEWQAPQPADSIIAFTPEGRVVSNLPSLLGTTSLIVSGPATLGSQTIAGMSYPLTQAAHRPYLVQVSAEGLVRVQSGFPLGNTVADLVGVSERPVASPLPPVGSPPDSHDPELVSIDVYPPRSPSLPSDIDASVQVGQYLRLDVRAKDLDGGPLTLEWLVERPSGKEGLGSFSFDSPVQMEWREGQWQSVWEWTPPDNVDTVVPEEFILTYRLRDRGGRTLEGHLGASSAGKIWALKDGLVLFDVNDGTANRSIYSVNSDGSNLRRLTFGDVPAAFPAASPWGDTVAVVGFGEGLSLMTRDGSEFRTVLPSAPSRAAICRVCWNPDGTMLCFTTRDFSGSDHATALEDLYVVNADGTGLRLLQAGFRATEIQASSISWGFIGPVYDRSDLASQFVFYTPREEGGSVETLRVSLADGSLQPLGVNFPPGVTGLTDADLAPNRQDLVVAELPSYTLSTYRMNPVTNRFDRVGQTSVGGGQPVFSLAGDKIFFSAWESGKGVIKSMDADGTNVKTLSVFDRDAQGPTWLLGGGEAVE